MVRYRWQYGLALVFSFASALYGQEESEVGGEELVMYRCVECHTLKRVFRAHYDSLEWSETIGRMEEQGLYVEDEERAAIIAFLVGQREERSLLQLMGMQHFLLLHFPVVLILIAALFEGMALWRKEGLAEGHANLVARLAVATTAATIALGFALIWERETLAPGLVLHRNLGIAAGVLMLVALVGREMAVKRASERAAWIYRGALLLAVILVGLTADRGGVLVHGNFIQDTLELVLG